MAETDFCFVGEKRTTVWNKFASGFLYRVNFKIHCVLLLVNILDPGTV